MLPYWDRELTVPGVQEFGGWFRGAIKSPGGLATRAEQRAAAAALQLRHDARSDRLSASLMTVADPRKLEYIYRCFHKLPGATAHVKVLGALDSFRFGSYPADELEGHAVRALVVFAESVWAWALGVFMRSDWRKGELWSEGVKGCNSDLTLYQALHTRIGAVTAEEHLASQARQRLFRRKLLGYLFCTRGAKEHVANLAFSTCKRALRNALDRGATDEAGQYHRSTQWN